MSDDIVCRGGHTVRVPHQRRLPYRPITKRVAVVYRIDSDASQAVEVIKRYRDAIAAKRRNPPPADPPVEDM